MGKLYINILRFCLYFVFMFISIHSIAQLTFPINSSNGIWDIGNTSNGDTISNFVIRPAMDICGLEVSQWHIQAPLAGVAASNRFNANGFNASNFALAVADHNYFTCTIQTENGVQLVIDSFYLALNKSNAQNADSFRLQWSLDGINFTDYQQFTHSATGAFNKTLNASNIIIPTASTLTLRLVIYGGNKPSSTVGIVKSTGFYGHVTILSKSLHVDSTSGNDLNDGRTWASAKKTLSNALIRAHECNYIDSILVAKGTYYPTGLQNSFQRDSSFLIERDNLSLIGGYNAFTGSRDIIANPSILSGDIGNVNDPTDNSFHILVMAADNLTGYGNVIDGFTFQYGNADQNGQQIINTFLVLNNNGAALYLESSKLSIHNCELIANSASGHGGGTWLNNSVVAMENVNYFENESYKGGAVASESSSIFYVNGKMQANIATYGGVWHSSAMQKSQFVNLLFSGNKASQNGSAWYAETNDSLYFINNTFGGNNSGFIGGGSIYLNSSNSSNIRLQNSIVWGNLSGITGGTLAADNSIVQGGGSGTWNFNPYFVAPISQSSAPVIGGNYRLASCSPAINVGDINYLPANIQIDLDYNNRVMDGIIDLGAYEYQYGPQVGNVLYVDSANAVSGDGSSWANAFTTLKEALEAAERCIDIDSILVAKGTYYPTGIQTSIERSKSFAIPRSNLKVLGGYDAASGNRDWMINPSILSGDIGVLNDEEDNSFHVVLIAGINDSDSVVIDGFTIRDGNANSPFTHNFNSFSINNDRGGGIYIGSSTDSLIAIRNCAVINHRSTISGAGLYISLSKATFFNVKFAGNQPYASSSGGGGIYIYKCHPVFYNAVITGNRSNSNGAAVYVRDIANPLFINATISGNLVGNGSNSSFGGIYATSQAQVSLTNSIVYGNAGQGYSAANTVLIEYSLVQGNAGGSNNNLDGSIDPLFVQPLPPTSAPSVGGDYQLLPCSPAIDKGNNAALPAGLTDFLGGNRIVNNIVDLGAYEIQVQLNPESDTLDHIMCSVDSFLFHGNWYFNSGFYIDTVFNSVGCDSFWHVLNLMVKDSVHTTEDLTTCANQFPYLWNGISVTSGGIGVATHSDTTIFGCDSIVTLNLIVNPVLIDSLDTVICQGNIVTYNGTDYSTDTLIVDTFSSAGGCDSIFTFKLSVNPVLVDSLDTVICQGNIVTYNGSDYISDTLIVDTFSSAAGCDSVFTFKLTVNPVLVDSLNTVICQGNIVTYNGNDYSSDTLIVDTFSSAAGCDSIFTFKLTVNPVLVDSLDAVICQGNFVTYNGNDYGSDTLIVDTFSSAGGCDSIFTFKLTVNPILVDSLDTVICQGNIVTYNGNDYSSDTLIVDTFSSVGGCDSVFAFKLTVNPVLVDSLDTVICQGNIVTYNGNDYSSDTLIIDTFSSAGGCDSIFTFKLTVNPVLVDSLDTVICQGNIVTYNGTDYSSDTLIVVTFSSASGCDSIFTFKLTVNPVLVDSLDTTICQGNVVTYNGTDYSSDTLIVDTFSSAGGCDSIFIFKLTVNPVLVDSLDTVICQGNIVTYNGNDYSSDTLIVDTFSSAGGCDSIFTFKLTVNPVLVDSLDTVICQGNIVSYNGTDYGSDTLIVDTFSSAGGCDSIFIFKLTVNPVLVDSLDTVICQGNIVTYNGNDYGSDTLIVDTLSSASGCDSIFTFKLTVNPVLVDSLDTVICQGNIVTYNGNDYSSDTLIVDTFSSSGGCDSIFTFKLTVNPILVDSLDTVICQGNIVTYNGNDYSSDTLIVDTFSSAGGCDSVFAFKLTVNPILVDSLDTVICQGNIVTYNGNDYSSDTLIVDTFSSSGGCDSIFTFKLTVNPILVDSLDTVICQGNIVTYNGNDYSSDTLIVDTFSSAEGCDSIFTFKLTVNPVLIDSLDTVICQGNIVTYNGNDYSSDTLIVDTFSSAAGCDSIFTFKLTVNPVLVDNLDTVICQGNIVTYNGNDYSSDTLIVDTFSSAAGCDSIFTFKLTVNPILVDSLDTVICQGNIVIYNGTDYSSDTLIVDTFSSASGCDSIFTFKLTVNPVLVDSLDTVICQGNIVTYNGNDYSSDTLIVDTFSSAGGCDSIFTFKLIVNPVLIDSLDTVICQGNIVTYNGNNYSSDTLIVDTFSSASGCDSIFTFKLTVNPILVDSLDTVICQGNFVTYNGNDYSSDTLIIDTFSSASGCDSIFTFKLTVNPVLIDSLDTLICQGNIVTYNGNDYSSDTLIVDTFSTVGGCDSIFTFNLTVNPVLVDSLDTVICQGNIVTYNGNDYSSDTLIVDTFSSAGGCDSIFTFKLTVNPILVDSLDTVICQGNFVTYNGNDYSSDTLIVDTFSSAGGCDSIFTFKLTVNPILVDSLDTVICQGNIVTYNGTDYSSDTLIVDTFSSAAGCDSIFTFKLTVNPVLVDSLDTIICQGNIVTYNGNDYSSDTLVVDTFSSASGCDSVFTFKLTVNPLVYHTFDTTICQGQSIVFNGATYNSAVTAADGITDTFTSATGCDSIVTLVLAIDPYLTGTFDTTICQGQSIVFNGVSYNTAITAADGITDTFISATGCDSIVTLVLTVDPYLTGIFDTTICQGQSIVFNGVTYNTAITVVDGITDTTQTAAGCDSIVTLVLTIDPYLTGTFDTTICQGQSIVFNGISYNTTVTAADGITDTFTSAGGCDSIVTLVLTVDPYLTGTFDTTICQGQSIVFNGVTYNSAITAAMGITDTTQAASGCDSITTLVLTINPYLTGTFDTTICQGQSIVFNGVTYNSAVTAVMGITDTTQAASGCDSITTLVLTILGTEIGPADTIEACWSIVHNGQLFTSDAILYDTLYYAGYGCDSAYIPTYLWIHPADTQTLEMFVDGCDSVVFEGNIYTSNAQLIDTLFNQYGCDSLYRQVEIVVYHVPLIVEDEYLENCESITLYGETYYQDTTIIKVYQDIHGCDSFQLNSHLAIYQKSYDTVLADICTGEKYEFNGDWLSAEGLYTAAFWDDHGCDSFVTVDLRVHPLPVLSITTEVEEFGYCIGDEITLKGYGADEYLWWSGNMVWGTEDEVTVLMPNEMNTYWMKGTDSWSCSDSVSISLKAEHCCDIFVPNAFSPNDDGLNDAFGAETLGYPYDYKLVVFNNLGQKVFQSFNIKDKWDGTFNGQPCDVGVYFFQISARCSDGTSFNKKGDVTLLR